MQNETYPMPIITGEIVRGPQIWAFLEGAGKSLSDGIAALPRVESNTARAKPTSSMMKLDGVAVLPIVGTVTKRRDWWSWFFATTPLDEFRRSLADAVADPSIQQIILLVDSPGGTIVGVDDAARDILKARQKKPITAFVEDLAASPGFWLASAASRVIANPSAWVGSIGVYLVANDVSKAFDADGVKTHVIRSGEWKGRGTPGEEITKETLQHWQHQVDVVHAQFARSVAAGRRLSLDAVLAIADGSLRTATSAKASGLIDEIADFSDVFAEIAAAAAKAIPARRPLLAWEEARLAAQAEHRNEDAQQREREKLSRARMELHR